MKQLPDKQPDHVFILPVSIDLPPEIVAVLSHRILSLPPNLSLNPKLRRFIDLSAEVLFYAGLFLSAVTIEQLTELYRAHFSTSDINERGIKSMVDQLFNESDTTTSGIYQVVRCGDLYRFAFDLSVLPTILSPINEQLRTTSY